VVLQDLQPALAPRERLIVDRHQPDIEAEKILGFPFRRPGPFLCRHAGKVDEIVADLHQPGARGAGADQAQRLRQGLKIAQARAAADPPDPPPVATRAPALRRAPHTLMGKWRQIDAGREDGDGGRHRRRMIREIPVSGDHPPGAPQDRRQATLPGGGPVGRPGRAEARLLLRGGAPHRVVEVEHQRHAVRQEQELPGGEQFLLQQHDIRGGGPPSQAGQVVSLAALGHEDLGVETARAQQVEMLQDPEPAAGVIGTAVEDAQEPHGGGIVTENGGAGQRAAGRRSCVTFSA